MKRRSLSAVAPLEYLLPGLALLILIVFTYGRFFQMPYAGFRYSNAGEVVQIFVEPAEAEETLQLGDQLQKIGPVTWAEYEENQLLTFFQDVEPGDIVPIIVERDEQSMTIPWPYSGPTANEALERFNSQWWLPFVFWAAGLATSLFIRPRNLAWLLLQAFNYLTGIWLAAGSIAMEHTLGALPIFKSAIWLSIPVYLHLHWVFPRRLGKLPAPFWWAVYGLAVLLIAVEWTSPLPSGAYGPGFLLAVVGSLALLIFRYGQRPAQRYEIQPLFGGFALAFLPPLAALAAELANIKVPPFLAGGTLMALAAIPGAYFLTLYRLQLGFLESQVRRLVRIYALAITVGTGIILLLSIFAATDTESLPSLLTGTVSLLLLAGLAVISFAPLLSLLALAGAYDTLVADGERQLGLRANRLLVPYLFLVGLGTASALLTIFIEARLNLPGAVALAGTAMALAGSLLAIRFYHPFRRLVESRLLGISLPPADLVEFYATRIPANLERENLTHLMTRDLLPSLLIRQSALLSLQTGTEGQPDLTAVYIHGVSEPKMPGTADLAALLAESGRYRLPDRNAPCPWAHLILPLEVSDQTIGLWLLGDRDPDDLYSREDIHVLQALAGQTAVALANIRQAENLQTLYEANIERHEVERSQLARELHDVVLHQLGQLRMEIDTPSLTGRFERLYNRLKKYLRQTISGLRPAMLTYGLGSGLEELVDSLNERTQGKINCTFQQAGMPARYPLQVEQHLFRIVQQAAENALRHARATTISIDSHFSAGAISISVSDNGQGFDGQPNMELDSLLKNGHYGLVNMHERARLINARLTIESAAGQGTAVTIRWRGPAR